jgi:alpha-L-rhamnosidase
MTVAASATPASASKTTPTAACLPESLLCEYLTDPLGIDETEPRLSWQLKAPDAASRGAHQSAYRIVVASSPELLGQDKGDLWDSGKVPSEQSVHVVYAGRPLRSRMRCHWKVMIWDNGKPSVWSKPAFWSMGLLSADDWSGSWIGLDEPAPASEPWFSGAQWIWYPEGNPREDSPAGPCYFLCDFELPATSLVASARLYAIADGKCKALVNGTSAGEGGSVRTDDCWKKPEPLDVRALLEPGRNILAIEAENTTQVPWTPGLKPGQKAPNPAGMIGLLKIRFEDGLEWTLPTGRDWRTSRTAEPGWAGRPAAASGWLAAAELGAFGVTPWEKVGPDEYTVLPTRMLRREFEVRQTIRRATAHICGLGYYELYLNGRRVGDHVMDPVLSDYEKKAHYVTYDVTEHLRAGRNAVGIILGNAAFFSYRKKVPAPFRTFGLPKALLNIRLEFEDGSFEDIVTDRDWKGTAGGPIRANNEYDGETYDARLEQPGWSEPGFAGPSWRTVKLVDPPGGRLASQMLEPLRVVETLRPIAITEPRPGIFVVDFGQTFNGWVRLSASGPAGTEIRLRRGGILRNDGMIRREDSRSALMTDVYIMRGNGTETWSPRFTSQGGRYVEVRGFPGRPSTGNFEGLVIHTDMQPAGTFECSNDLVNKLCRMMRWSQRIEARGIPLDCSTRDERMPWISEHHGLDGHAYTFRAIAMYANWLEDLRIAQRADGSMPDVAPSFWTFSQDVVWPVTLIYLPHWAHEFYGDTRAIERSYPAMKRFVRFVEATHLKSDGTIDYNENGDWLDATAMDGVAPDDGRPHPFVGATSQPLMATAYFCFYCSMLEKYARMLGRTEDAAWFAELGSKVRQGFERRFFDPAANAYTGRTQTSYVLPLAFGLVPEDRRAAVARNLAEDILEKHHGYTTCGFMGVQWILTVLSESGHHDAAWSILTRTERPSWGYMVAKGATTMWERWDHDTADPTMTGESQYFLGAGIVGWLYQCLAGINPDPERSGFKRVILRPRPVHGLDWVKASFQSMYGPIASEWKCDGSDFLWKIEVPPNTDATAFIPTRAPASVTESGRPATQSAGVRFLRAEPDYVVYRLAAGTYHFQSGWKSA